MRSSTVLLHKIFRHYRLWKRNLQLIWAAVPGLSLLWAALLIIQGLMPVVTVYLVKATVDSFVRARQNYNDPGQLNSVIFFFGLAGATLLLSEVVRLVVDWVRTAQAEHLSDHIKNLMHIKSTEVDLAFYDSDEYHDLMEQARGESQAKPLAILGNMGSVVQSLITLGSFAAVLFSYGWPIPLLLVMGAFPGLYVSLRSESFYHRWWKQTAPERRWLAYYDAMLSHSDAAAEMRLFDLGPRFRLRYQVARRRLRNEKLKQLRKQALGKSLATALSLAVAGIAIGWIGLRVYNGQASFGDLAVFYQIFNTGQGMMVALLAGASQMISNSLYLESLFRYLDLPSAFRAPKDPISFPSEIKKGIRFTNVTFSYPGEARQALSSFSVFVPAGKTVAIVGVNGAGKSTIIKLLCRFYDPQEGTIEIDDVDIRAFDVKELRRGISVLFQNSLRFHETAGGSIALGDTAETPDLPAIKRIAIRAGADRFISRLPKRYETLLGKWFVDGCELSGGEWQKIALARAYFRKAPIIVLDEPTSFMDSWAEADWFDRFRSLSHGQTGLIITHRFTIAMRTDIIHVLDDSRLVESGTHQELLELDGFYARSWKDQMSVIAEKQSDLRQLLTQVITP